MAQTIEAALADVMGEYVLTRIDVGLTDYSLKTPYVVTVWFDAPAGMNGCASQHGATIDEALTLAIAEMDGKFAALLADAA